MQKILVLAFVALLVASHPIAAAPSFGLQSSGNLSGFSVKIPEANRTSQYIGSVFANGHRTEIEVGTRLLLPFGTRGRISQYYGLGGGYQYLSTSNQASPQHTLRSQAFVGLDFPLSIGEHTLPLNLSIEAILLADMPINDSLHLRNSVGVGLHYQF